MDENSTTYTGPWEIDNRHPYGDLVWSIVNNDTGQTAKIGAVQSKGVNYYDRAKAECEKRNEKVIRKQVELDRVAVGQFIADIRFLDFEGWKKWTPYDHEHSPHMHLFECVRCGGPTFQYRCPLCFWGPEESGIRAHERSYKLARALRDSGDGAMTFEGFVRSLGRYDGRYAPFYFAANMQTVAYGKNATYRDMTSDLIANSHKIKHPSLATIWRYVKHARIVTPDLELIMPIIDHEKENRQ